jgi:PAS domain S-box-containing protein
LFVAGKFPRLALLAAFLLPLFLVLDLEFLHTSASRLLISNVVLFAVVALAAVCCLRVALRSSGPVRQVWFLVSVALWIEVLAQGLSTYYQSYVPGALLNPEPPDILFFVWAAPVFMIFLPHSDEEPPRIDSIRLLDFLQVSIVAITIYAYFFYAPSRWQNDQLALVRSLLILYIVRDLLLAGGFLFRARTSLFSWFRSFSIVFAFVFVVAALSDVEYFLNVTAAVGDATWGDILWMLPYVAVIIFALRWKQPEPVPVAFPSTGVSNFFASQFLPVGLPLFVILMARAISREQFLLGWLTVIASVVCSSVRLILTNRRQRVVASELLSAEKALRRSEQMLSTAFRSSPDSFSINIFPNGPYLEVNEGFTRLTSYTRDETLNRSPSQMNLWVDPAERAKVLARLTQTGDVRDVEFHFRTKDGQTRVGLMSASIIELDSRPCALVVVRDITARKEAEDILRTREERFRSLVQNLHVGIVTYDPDARILFANQAVVDLLNLPLEQLIGKTSPELGLTPLREDGSLIPGESRPVATVLATRQPVRNLLIGWRRPSVAQDVWTLLDAVPEFSATGDLLRVVVSFTDLTEQRRAAEALRESEERFRTLVSDLHIAVVLHRPDRRIEFANAAAYRMFDVPEGTAVGKLPSDYGVVVVDETGTELAPAENPVDTVFRTHASVPNGLLGIRRSGTDKILWAFGNAVPQFGANGNVIRVITSFADVTEMKNVERAIHQLSTRLLSLQDEERRRIGRELHDGLAQTVLAINLSLAQVRQSLPASEHPAVRAIEKARALTQQMSREIRTLSYLLHPPLLDDLGLVSALREYAQGFSERSGIDTQLYVLSEFARLPQLVELALFRIVQESLANVQRHSGSATAKILLRRENSLITLEVLDSGRGMNLAANSSAQPGDARLGVGIPGMRERIAQLGGHLEIVSNSKGTTVRATISVSDVPGREDIADIQRETTAKPA